MGELFIKTAPKGGRTIVADSFFTAPFKIVAPFQCGSGCEIMIMMASAGILDGDRHDIRLDIGEGSRVTVTGQSYTKLFKSERGARQKVEINIKKGATLYYMPCPTIPFENSKYRCDNIIRVEKGAKLAMWDILSCGRIGMGERFRFTKYQSHTTVYEDGRLVFADNTLLCPQDATLSGIGFFEGHTHMGMAYLYNFPALKTEAFAGTNAAKTEAKCGEVVRMTAECGEEITDFFEKLIYKEEEDV